MRYRSIYHRGHILDCGASKRCGQIIFSRSVGEPRSALPNANSNRGPNATNTGPASYVGLAACLAKDLIWHEMRSVLRWMCRSLHSPLCSALTLRMKVRDETITVLDDGTGVDICGRVYDSLLSLLRAFRCASWSQIFC